MAKSRLNEKGWLHFDQELAQGGKKHQLNLRNILGGLGVGGLIYHFFFHISAWVRPFWQFQCEYKLLFSELQ